jgi:hypothetical protein
VNIKIIETARELEVAVGQILSECATPTFITSRPADPAWDFVAEATLDGKRHLFGVDCKLRPEGRDVERLAARCTGPLPLLATVKASDSLIEHCKRHFVSCVDLNGRLWLRAKGVVVDRNESSGRDRFRTADAPVNAFSLKASRLARAMLSYPSRQWRQLELAELTGLSQGLLSRLLKNASRQGWVEGSRGDWSVSNPSGLLDAWKAADVWTNRVRVHQYSTLEGDLRELAERVLNQISGDVAFTQWFAAGLRFPYADVPIVSAYVSTVQDAKLRESLGIREVSSGGKLWLITPHDAGVFQAVRRVETIPIVCDAQIYLDLLQVGLRGPDQAEALRSWKGFCQV